MVNHPNRSKTGLRTTLPQGKWVWPPREPPLALRTLILACELVDEARRLDAVFADQTDVLTLASGAKSEQANALYVAADLVRRAHAKIKDMKI